MKIELKRRRRRIILLAEVTFNGRLFSAYIKTFYCDAFISTMRIRKDPRLPVVMKYRRSNVTRVTTNVNKFIFIGKFNNLLTVLLIMFQKYSNISTKNQLSNSIFPLIPDKFRPLLLLLERKIKLTTIRIRHCT